MCTCACPHVTTFGWGSFVFKEKRAVARNWLTWFWLCVLPQMPRWHAYNILIKEAWEEFHCDSRCLCFQLPKLWLPLFRYLISPFHSLSITWPLFLFPCGLVSFYNFKRLISFISQLSESLTSAVPLMHFFVKHDGRVAPHIYIYTHRPCSVSYCHHQACFI